MALDLSRTKTNLMPTMRNAEIAARRICAGFRAQPIVNARTFDIQGVELLYRPRMNFNDHEAMLKADIRAVKAAAIMAKAQAYASVHCNVEVQSMIQPDWLEAMIFCINEGMVIEIVERNSILMDDLIMGQAKNVVMLVRSFGGKIAMDDVRFTDQNAHIIEKIQPDIIKVEREDYVPRLRKICDAPIVVERIETRRLADSAIQAGADLLQGYYCDLAVQNEVPSRLTPPGVMDWISRKAKTSTEPVVLSHEAGDFCAQLGVNGGLLPSI